MLILKRINNILYIYQVQYTENSVAKTSQILLKVLTTDSSNTNDEVVFLRKLKLFAIIIATETNEKTLKLPDAFHLLVHFLSIDTILL